MNYERILLTICFVLFLHSCVLYPKYERPAMEMPDKWRTPSDETSTVVNSRWWSQLNDSTLDELIEEALHNNQDLRVATARIAEYRAQVGIVSSQLYPQIYAQGTVFRERISPTTAGQLGSTSQDAGILNDLFPSFSPYFNDYRAVFTASYEVDVWGKIRSATNASIAELYAQLQARRTIILTVVSEVAKAYIRLRQYDAQLAISLHTLQSRQESYELAQIRFVEGLTSELEVKQAIAERDEAAIQMIEFKTLIPQQENLLSVLLGHPPQAIQRGVELDSLQLPPEVPTGLPFDLLEQRPDILQAEEEFIASNFRIGEARALFFPDLTLTGFYGYESEKLHQLFLNPSRTWQWLIDLLQPLFTGGRLISTLDLAKAQNQEALYNYLRVILNALQEVDNSLIAHKNSREAFLVQRQRVKDLEDYLRLAELQYNNGLVDYLNVLDAQRQLFGAQLDLTYLQASIYLTLVDIYKALGGGWVVDAENLMKDDCTK